MFLPVCKSRFTPGPHGSLVEGKMTLGTLQQIVFIDIQQQDGEEKGVCEVMGGKKSDLLCMARLLWRDRPFSAFLR